MKRRTRILSARQPGQGQLRLPGAARARASIPSPATKTGTPSRQSTGPSRCHAGRPAAWNCSLRLRGGRPTPAWKRSPGRRGAHLQRGAAAAAMPPADTADLDRPLPAGSSCTPGRPRSIVVGSLRRLRRPPRRLGRQASGVRQTPAMAAQLARGGRPAHRAGERHLAQQPLDEARRCGSAGGAAQPGAQGVALPRRRERAPGSDVEIAVDARRRRGRSRPLRRAPRSPPGPSRRPRRATPRPTETRLRAPARRRGASGCGRSAGRRCSRRRRTRGDAAGHTPRSPSRGHASQGRAQVTPSRRIRAGIAASPATPPPRRACRRKVSAWSRRW
jgi:hypothetical protein